MQPHNGTQEESVEQRKKKKSPAQLATVTKLMQTGVGQGHVSHTHTGL